MEIYSKKPDCIKNFDRDRADPISTSRTETGCDREVLDRHVKMAEFEVGVRVEDDGDSCARKFIDNDGSDARRTRFRQ